MTTTTDQPIDQEKAEAFSEKVLGIFSGGCLSLMLSVGHQTGLFDKLAELPASTSQEIAGAAGLQERYVREWLGGMVTGGIVEYDAAARTYRLPPEHAGMLTRAAGPNNFAFFTQYVGLMGLVEPKVVDAFRNGGGVPYSEYPNFQSLQREETSAVYDATLLNGTLPLVLGLVEGLQKGIDVADVGCGAGYALCLMAAAYPNSRFAGYDFSEEGVAFGRSEAAGKGLTNVTFEVMDISTLSGPPRFDLITAFDTIHDQAQPRRVLKGICEALKPDGDFLCVDIAGSSNLEENISNPMTPLFFTFSVFHCMTVSLAQHGEGLGTMWGEQKARELFAEAGFGRIETRQVEGDFMNNYYLVRK
ncbi:MAG: methyltransferase domain-containing protein [Dehalococcoidia bacterium]|nr:methyltransferase domain-containing protein [Dehalococcoidia bacterium]